MADEIVNRVANSKLITFDLEEFYPEGERVALDIKDWLFEGLVLREKEFRASLKNHDWPQYQNNFVALHCSTDAVVPAWAYMLITTYLEPYTKKIVVGNLEDLEVTIFQEIINKLDVAQFKDKPVIIKGCSNKPVPMNAYIQITSKLKSVAKSVMYGEACSSVPLYKR
ncbi:MAG: DUF2480 family protein [Bacteroidia bacterium]|nr:DUF2480 family protein [Bacteroidia bacterium]MBT8308859.1 DUF2480 family protein [Bacteroidia bacterium]NNK27224.1 DUF2480 family protein [Flavobacteriaceae bacterium]NNL61155.1 DUF2480 family protein [Flavobacteriaceae bacterium]